MRYKELVEYIDISTLDIEKFIYDIRMKSKKLVQNEIKGLTTEELLQYLDRKEAEVDRRIAARKHK